MSEHDIFLHDGQTEYRLTVEKGEPWGESPWLFTEKDTKDEFDFLGEGSRQTRFEKGWVLAHNSQKYEIKDNGNCRAIGNIPSFNRILYELNGTVDFLSSENERYRISCHADKDSTETYSIVGKVLLEALNSYPIYVGFPQINISNTEKSRGQYRTQWRSLHCQGKSWNGTANDCVGPVWIRLVDTTNGIEVFRRKIYVLPKSFKLDRMISAEGLPGKYRFYGLGKAKVTTENGETITEIEHADIIEVSCPSIKNTSLPQLLVKLYWPTHGQLTISLPYPQRGAMLQLAGKTLQYDDYVSLDRMGGLRLLLQDPIGSESYWIEAEPLMANHTSSQSI